jgi:hypothetical protein
MPGLHINSPSVALSIAGMHGISSVVQATPPLEGFFGSRFDERWTPEMEGTLLERFGLKKDDPGNHFTQVVETVYYNQVEDPDSDAPRLNRDQIAKIITKKNRA